MWSNTHTHSHFCDGKGPLAEYVAEAERLAMISLGFSSHAPLPFATPWCMKAANLRSYIESIAALKKQHTGLQLYAGLEVDFIPGAIGPSQFRHQLDYTIGSIHFVDTFPDGRGWEIDGLHTHFMEGLDVIFKGNVQDAIARYFELTRQMIDTDCPDIVGHLDKIKIQNIDEKLFRESDIFYRDQVEQTVSAIKKSGSIVEVNTRGLYQKKSTTPYPSPWILELLAAQDVPVTLNSDAHHAGDLVQQFSPTAALLQRSGFKTISILHEGAWRPFAFNAYGIIR